MIRVVCDVLAGSFRSARQRHLLVCGWLGFAFSSLLANADESQFTLKSDGIQIRDPYIVAYQPEGVYLMVARSDAPATERPQGVQIYRSKDLVHWTPPCRVLTLDTIADVAEVWAPEMHQYNGKYYIFVTLGLRRSLPAGEGTTDSTLPMRGVYVFVAESPYGPFLPLKSTSHTPENWSTLDGTLYVEDGIPYMVFCHEWTQIVNGTIESMPLKEDLSDATGPPKTLFCGSDAPEADKDPNARHVTDGCFLYRSQESKKLYMMWSTLIPGKDYCVVLAESASGKLVGPWRTQRLLYTHDGGHSMFFQGLDGDLRMSLHQPNNEPNERLRLFKVVERNGKLDIHK
jgi:GH43 family beta-xylosidase